MLRLRRLVVLVPVLAAVAGCGSSGPPPPSTLLFVSSRDGDYAIFGVSADGDEHRLTKEKGDPSSPAGLFFQVDPAWSPDGRKIAFVSRRDGRSHIYVMRADGTGSRRLTDSTPDDDGPTWSPDGRRIAFQSNANGGHVEIYSIGLDGSGLRRETRSEIDTFDPDWSPDGRKIAFSRNGAIWTIDRSGRERKLTSGRNDAAPVWRPRAA
jgi:TolB protein